MSSPRKTRESQRIRIAYTGSNLSAVGIDAGTLGTTLTAFDKLVHDVGGIFGMERHLRLSLTPDSIREGSFDITLLLELFGLPPADSVLASMQQATFSDLLDVLGRGQVLYSLGKPVIKGLFHLAKRRKYPHMVKQVMLEDETPENARLIYQDGTSDHVFIMTLLALSNPDILEDLKNLFRPLLREEGVDGFELRNPDNLDDKTPLLQINRSEAHSICELKPLLPFEKSNASERR
jgi:hypothetical protein